MFTVNEHYDNVPIFYAYDISTGKIEYAIFSYDEESRLLTLCFDGLICPNGYDSGD